MKRLSLMPISVVLALVCMVGMPLLAAQTSSWEIVSATYGSGNNWVDVTERVRSLVEGDSLDFKVNGTTLGAGSRRIRRSLGYS